MANLVPQAPHRPPSSWLKTSVRQDLSGAHRDYLQSSRGEETGGLPSLGPSGTRTWVCAASGLAGRGPKERRGRERLFCSSRKASFNRC